MPCRGTVTVVAHMGRAHCWRCCGRARGHIIRALSGAPASSMLAPRDAASYTHQRAAATEAGNACACAGSGTAGACMAPAAVDRSGLRGPPRGGATAARQRHATVTPVTPVTIPAGVPTVLTARNLAPDTAECTINPIAEPCFAAGAAKQGSAAHVTSRWHFGAVTQVTPAALARSGHLER